MAVPSGASGDVAANDSGLIRHSVLFLKGKRLRSSCSWPSGEFYGILRERLVSVLHRSSDLSQCLSPFSVSITEHLRVNNIQRLEALLAQSVEPCKSRSVITCLALGRACALLTCGPLVVRRQDTKWSLSLVSCDC